MDQDLLDLEFEAVRSLIGGSQPNVAIQKLNEINETIKPEVFISSNGNFNPTFIQRIVHTLFPHTITRNDAINKTVMNIITHWLNVVSSLAPLQFLNVCQAIVDDESNKQFIGYLLPSIASAIVIQPVQIQSQYVEIVLSIVKNSSPEQIRYVPHHLWTIFSSLLSVDQIKDLISSFNYPQYSQSCAVLVAKEPNTLIPCVFEKENLGFISRFISVLNPGYQFDITDLLTSIEDTFTNKETPETKRDEAPLLLGNIIKYFKKSYKEDDRSKIIEIIQKSFECLKNSEITPTYKSAILYLLHMSVINNLADPQDVINFIEISSRVPSKVKIISFQMFFDMFKLEMIQENVFPPFLEVASCRRDITFSFFIDNFYSIYPSLREIDEEQTFEIINRFLNPLPLDPTNGQLILKLLNNLSNEEINILTLDISSMIYQYASIKNNVVINELKKFIKKIHFHLDYYKLDWLGSGIKNSLQLYPDIDFVTLDEILEEQLLDIREIPYALEIIKKDAHSYFTDLNTFLIMMAIELGYESKHKYEHPWVFPEMIHKLFVQIMGPIIHSSFGILTNRLMYAVSAALDSGVEDLQDIDELANVVVFLLPYFAEIGFEILIKLRKANVEIKEIDTFVIPAGSAGTFFKFELLKDDIEKIMEKHKDLVAPAIASNREIASLLASKVDQPLPMYATFLSFEGIEKHKEWFEKCKENVSPSEWKLIPEDRQKIESMDLDQSTKEMLLAKLEPVEKQGVDEEFEVELPPREFKLQPIEVVDGPKIRESELPSEYGLLSFLWHSKKDYPGDLSELESYVLDHSTNKNLVIGFFGYIMDHEFSVNITKWAEILKYKTEDDLLVCSLFLGSVKVKWDEMPDQLEQFIRSVMNRLGFYYSNIDDIVIAFKRSNGLKKFFIEKLINIDLTKFDDFPVITARFGPNKETEFSMVLAQLPKLNLDQQFDLLVNAMEAFMNPPDIELTYTGYSIPSRILIPAQLKSFVKFIPITPPYELNQVLIDGFIGAIARQQQFPLHYFSFFLNIKLVPRQIPLAQKLFGVKNDILTFMMPVSYLEDKRNFGDTELSYFEHRPPSFGIKFMRSLMSPFAPAINQKTINQIIKVLNQDDYELPHQSGEFVGREAILKYVNHITNNDKCSINRLELSENLLHLTVTESSTIDFADNAFKAVSKFIDNDQLAAIICNVRFFNSPNFACVCYLFRCLKDKVKGTEAESLTSVFDNEAVDVFSDEKKAKIFKNQNNDKGIADSLHIVFE